jgi:hypothetical protein
VAASVRIEDEAFSDTRIELLGSLLGTSKYDALGRLAYVWRQATATGKYTLPESVVAHIIDVEKLVSAKLAVKTKTGVRIRGARGRVEWLERARVSGRLNGPKGAEFGQLGGRPKKTPTKPGGGVTENPLPAPAPAPAPVTALKTKRQKIAAKPPTPRPRDPLFDAIAEVTGFDPATAGGQIGKVAATLRKAEPEYTPESVREFGRRYWEICPYAAESRTERPTPTELEKYIGRLRAEPVANRVPAARAGPRNREDDLDAELRAAGAQ